MTSTKLRQLCAIALCFMVLSVMAVMALAGCQGPTDDGAAATQEAPAQQESVDVRVASLKGPTSIGLVDLMADAEAGKTQDHYDFSVVGQPDEVVQKVVSGEVDVALVPANVGAMLFQRTGGDVVCLDVNTLSVLDIVTANPEIDSFEDLAGKTVYLTGKGASPEYVMNYLLAKDDLKDSVHLEYKSEATEVVAALAADPQSVAVLPQPFATAATMKNTDLSIKENLGEAWRRVAPEGSELVTGVTIASKDFVDAHPEAAQRFVDAQAASVKAVNADPAAAAQLVVDKGIVDSAKVAEKAIPECSMVCLTGDEMKSALKPYLDVLFESDKASVGGEVPGDGFYWMGAQ